MLLHRAAHSADSIGNNGIKVAQTIFLKKLYCIVEVQTENY